MSRTARAHSCTRDLGQQVYGVANAVYLPSPRTPNNVALQEERDEPALALVHCVRTLGMYMQLAAV